MICGNCRADNATGTEFCQNCGHRLPKQGRSSVENILRVLGGICVFCFALIVALFGSCFVLLGGVTMNGGHDGLASVWNSLAYIFGGLVAIGVSLILFRAAIWLWK